MYSCRHEQTVVETPTEHKIYYRAYSKRFPFIVSFNDADNNWSTYTVNAGYFFHSQNISGHKGMVMQFVCQNIQDNLNETDSINVSIGCNGFNDVHAQKFSSNQQVHVTSKFVIP